MTRVTVLTLEFVEYIPADTRAGVLYISIPFATATHRCCCGCGNVVVTPLTPTDWSVTYDGETVSLNPSIGNWSFPCRSHYWIERNRVRWAPSWTREQVERGRAQDRATKDRFYSERPYAPVAERPRRRGWWQRLRGWLRLSS